MMKKIDMNLISVVALGIGSIVGAGIFALLGQVLMLSGERVYYAFVIAGIAAMFSGYSYARLAGKYPDSGGLTDYFHIAFPDRLISGTLSLIYMLTSAISVSMMAKSFGIYAAGLFGYPPAALEIVNSAAVVLILIMGFLNMQSAGDVGNTETLLVAVKLFILFGLAIAAFVQVGSAPVQAHPLITSDKVFWGSIGITFFAYAGYGVITNASADVKNPKRTITAAIFITLLVVMALYISLAWMVLTYIPLKELEQNSETAIAHAARMLLGDWGYAALYVAAGLAFVTGISATFFSIFRISRSLAKQNVLPKLYGEKFWRMGTKGNMLTVTLVVLATVLFDFSSIVNLSSGAFLVSYLGIFAANWKLRRETESSAAIILTGAALMVFILITFLMSLN